MFEVYPTANPDRPYRRLVRVNGMAPSDLAARDSEQAARTSKWARVRTARGESISAIRQRWERQEAERERRVFAEVADVFEIRFVGREDVDGRPVRVFDLVPLPDRHPKTWEARCLQKFAGRAWFDEADREVVRLDLESTDTVSYGLGFVARLNRGTRAVLERRKACDGTWVPVMTRFSGTGRFLLVKWFAFEQICEYTSYSKPDADRMVGFMER